ncbi:dockerin type I domain-containing protein [Aporhodopirellula aestuarii]|uniref:dockerin type I domain-containing protein n=1 Tax=Aporhodopirellula aestuarii TaxID=2950107 RepID=UPI00203467B1|nr:dockerin type I domain-containing protein [Aporhodopirellula aestuarii]
MKTRRRTAGRATILPRIERLEHRRLLAVMTHSALSLESMRDEIAGQFSSATVITHGFQLDGGGDSLMPLADAIVERNGGLLVDFDVDTGGGQGTFDLFESEARAGSELVLSFDWGDASNNDSAGWGEAAGDALFSIAVGLGLFDPSQGSENSIDRHFIGHSFGTAVTSEAVERLAAFDIPVGHLTYLDPHDFDQSRLPIDGSQDLDTLGLPLLNETPVYGATVWDNVIFADAYYQTNPLGFFSTNPGGRPIPGAYNTSVTTETSNASFPHSAVWNEYYLATITDPSSTTGYAFSSRNTNSIVRPTPRFYGSNQNHDHTPEALVNRTTGLPNDAGLESNGLTAAQITTGRWEPVWTPQINNGDFTFTGNGGSEVPGWAFHGGGGNAEIPSAADAVLPLQNKTNSRTHNWTYIPNDAAFLDYDVTIPAGTNAATLEVLIGDNVIETLAVDQLSSLERGLAANGGLTISSPIGSLANSVNTITYRVSGLPTDNSKLNIDDIRFANSLPVPTHPRIVIPEIITSEHVFASDASDARAGTAIIFAALTNTTLTATTSESTSFGRNMQIVNADLQPIGSRQGNSIFASLIDGEIYAVVAQSHPSDQTITLQSAVGEASLTRLAATNIFAPRDTNANGQTTAVDALRVINELNATSNSNGNPNRPPEPFLDVDGSGFISALDALRVINYLNKHEASGGEPTIDAIPMIAPLSTNNITDSERDRTQTASTLNRGLASLNGVANSASADASTDQPRTFVKPHAADDSMETVLNEDSTSPLLDFEYSLAPTFPHPANNQTLQR